MTAVVGAALAEQGRWMHDRIARLQPFPRSITGEGTRETLRAIAEEVPIQIQAIASGTKVLDWEVPPEWVLHRAELVAEDGHRPVDLEDHPLRVMGYSAPVHTTLSLEELLTHIHSIPEMPDALPYRTSYYSEGWGLCLRESEVHALRDCLYRIVIDSEFVSNGMLNYGEAYLPGELADEILVSCHVCHPWMANDNLSGISVAVELLKQLIDRKSRRYSYRFLFVPGTIGSISWLAQNPIVSSRVAHGFVLAGVGNEAAFTYKRSRRGDADVDRAFATALRELGHSHQIIDFEPYGYDERQYCSPGFDLPVGCLMRAKHGTYQEYHTSADDLTFVTPGALAASLRVASRAVDILENNVRLYNLGKGEPQLGRRGLYRSLGGLPNAGEAELAMLWVLAFSDGAHDLLGIAERADLSTESIFAAASALLQHGLVSEG